MQRRDHLRHLRHPISISKGIGPRGNSSRRIRDIDIYIDGYDVEPPPRSFKPKLAKLEIAFLDTFFSFFETDK